jgi:hypothetical protein
MAARKSAIPSFRSAVLHPSSHGHFYRTTIRYVHSSLPKSASVTAQPELIAPSLKPVAEKSSPLAILPTSQIIRSYLILKATSSPLLLRASFVILKRMLDPKAVILNPDRNPILKFVFKHTFYQQFCAGENRKDVQQSIKDVKAAGYTGIMLEYALEVLAGEKVIASPAEDLETWRNGMLDTVDMCSPGDFVGLKWSGIGTEALKILNAGEPPSEEMHKAIIQVCDLAAKKDVGLLPGAELEVTNVGIDAWTIDLQRRYNKETPGKAMMYTTYQAYLKSTPQRLARDLAIAEKEGFTLGVKLVRGAYLASEPKSAVMESKQATDDAYDGLTAAVLTRQYNETLKPANPESTSFPPVAVMLASHNAVSVQKARKIRDAQAAAGVPLVICTYAQLQGMADEISCSLVAASKACKIESDRVALSDSKKVVDIPRAYKCATWGTIGQTLNFLYRRAYENQDAASRTVETRKAMAEELWRRSRAIVGMN